LKISLNNDAGDSVLLLRREQFGGRCAHDSRR